MKRTLRWFSGVLGVIALTALPALAQSDDLKALQKEVDTLKEGQKSIEKDLQEIKGLLQRQQRPAAAPAPPSEAVVSLDGAVVKGDANAKVALVDFTDYQ